MSVPVYSASDLSRIEVIERTAGDVGRGGDYLNPPTERSSTLANPHLPN